MGIGHDRMYCGQLVRIRGQEEDKLAIIRLQDIYTKNKPFDKGVSEFIREVPPSTRCQLML